MMYSVRVNDKSLYPFLCISEVTELNFARKIIFNVRIMVAFIMDFIFELCGESLIDKAYAGRISTTELVNMIYNFCEIYSGKVMYAYQTQFSKRIIRSVLENDGAEITALFSRQSGKTETVAITVGGLMIILPQLANMPMFADDSRLKMFKDGMWIGIFAPSLRQAQTTYGRLKARRKRLWHCLLLSYLCYSHC